MARTTQYDEQLREIENPDYDPESAAAALGDFTSKNNKPVRSMKELEVGTLVRVHNSNSLHNLGVGRIHEIKDIDHIVIDFSEAQFDADERRERAQRNRDLDDQENFFRGVGVTDGDALIVEKMANLELYQSVEQLIQQKNLPVALDAIFQLTLDDLRVTSKKVALRICRDRDVDDDIRQRRVRAMMLLGRAFMKAA